MGNLAGAFVSTNAPVLVHDRSLLLDAPTIEVLERVVNGRMRYYNEVRRHSVLGNQLPRKWLERWLIDDRKENLL